MVAAAVDEDDMAEARDIQAAQVDVSMPLLVHDPSLTLTSEEMNHLGPMDATIYLSNATQAVGLQTIIKVTTLETTMQALWH